MREGASAQFDLQYLEVVSRVAAHQQAERALLEMRAGGPGASSGILGNGLDGHIAS
ncbi:hypothetical protein D9M72_403700 [compost metagenome]